VGISDLMCVCLFISGELNILLVSCRVELYICYLGYFQRAVLIITCFLSNYRTGNELHEPKFSEDDMEFIVEDKNIKKETKEGQCYL
jgi:hypothetical protein